MPAKVKQTTVYQLKVTLNQIRPLIWRRIQTKDCSLGELHNILQVVMGWGCAHLYSFTIDDEDYGDPELVDDWEEGNARAVKLSQLVKGGQTKFTYLYDFGDSWDHTIKIEKTFPAEPKGKYPICVEGERACPPEDVGGIWGYQDFLEAIADPDHAEHDEMLEWAGESFDPEKFPLGEVNKMLRRV